ncbi:B12-binding domain-containing radical SAM protein [Rhodococcus erythropolis]|uniref:B12-binding domain-containing radical SAM protein n=1 Tax=Rhodococcus erythropolis TaxID=1833 RepID=UPI001C9A7EAE|nr:radical SAM protein [Rhodococcus erythropolis]MBY6385426.1 B12-binding domain-containing radical SAM protein [Rhodococcus erythropolis]
MNSFIQISIRDSGHCLESASALDIERVPNALKIAIIYPEVLDMARFQEDRKEFPPFGAMYLASVLENCGNDVKILSVDGGPGDRMDLSEFDVVGYSISSSVCLGMMRDSRNNSIIPEGTKVIAGGVHANFYPEETLREFDAKVVAYGESEWIIEEICRAESDAEYARIPGIVWTDQFGEVIKNPATPIMKNINTLPHPARHLIEKEKIVMGDRLAGTDLKMAHTMLSRGCPFPCTYCAAGQTRIQYRSGDSAREELIDLKRRYNIQGFAIIDDNFIVARQKVMEICDSISDLGLKWSALSRVDTVDKELLEKMREAGCIEIKFGVESGSDKILKAMKKRISKTDTLNAFQLCDEVGINAKAFIIHGYPGENLHTTDETMNLLREIGDLSDRVSLFRFVPLPGTQVYEEKDSAGEFVIHGTHLANDWDGDWSKFHLYRNGRHWWGSDDDFSELNDAYQKLREFVEERWGRQD